MGMIVADEQQEKSQLASEICEISARAIACAKFHRRSPTIKSPFINWYLVLRVDENADIYGIRRQYHKLALQLHPDKNKHSKAETAFKLVSEAYFCLSDGAKRAAFDSERHNTSCTKCNNNTIPLIDADPPNVKIRTPIHETTRLSRLQNRMHELRNKLRDEASVIEKCLVANAMRQLTKNAGGAKTELPVFNPSDYYQHKGTPQNRTIDRKVMEDLRAGFRIGSRCINDRAMNSSPVFQYQSGRSPFMSRCATTRDR